MPTIDQKLAFMRKHSKGRSTKAVRPALNRKGAGSNPAAPSNVAADDPFIEQQLTMIYNSLGFGWRR